MVRFTTITVGYTSLAIFHNSLSIITFYIAETNDAQRVDDVKEEQSTTILLPEPQPPIEEKPKSDETSDIPSTPSTITATPIEGSEPDAIDLHEQSAVEEPSKTNGDAHVEEAVTVPSAAPKKVVAEPTQSETQPKDAAIEEKPSVTEETNKIGESTQGRFIHW